ncbi:MAG: tannase/feruloyl esterase family alpha/beta hydrolase, partial [Candidatus Rokuibacteriota bacterium]
KVKLVADVVERKCGGPDGLRDDPRRCDFDPARDLPACASGADRADCFTRDQVATL